MAITITAVNDAPIAANDIATVAAGGTTTIPLTANDTDDTATDPTTIVVVGQPTAGTVTVNSDGTVDYTSTGTAATTDSFTYTVKDITGATSTAATVTITITAVNTPPVAVNDTATVAEGGTATVALITNDTDADGTIDAATVVIVAPPTAGTVTVNPNGTVTYASNGTEVTTDSFTYTVKDTAGAGSNTATVTITITPVNDAPVTVNDAYTVAGNGLLVVNAPGLLANDSDPEGNSFIITAATPPQHGTLTPYSNGAFTYRPTAGYAGLDSFTYTISDGTSFIQGTVTITVSAVLNQAPTGVADSYTVAEDGTLTVGAPGVLINDTDADGDAVVITAGTGTAHGVFTLNSDGSFTYKPVANFNGTDSFTYQASDGTLPSTPTTVTITVTAVNDDPVVNNDTIPIAKDSFGAFALANRSSDADGDTLTGILVTSTQHGTLVFLGSQRAFTYQPNAGYVGQDSFTYKVNDGSVDSAVATVTLNVS